MGLFIALYLLALALGVCAGGVAIVLLKNNGYKITAGLVSFMAVMPVLPFINFVYLFVGPMGLMKFMKKA